MPRFMLVLHEGDLASKMTPEDYQTLVEHYWRWTDEIKQAGTFLSGEALKETHMMIRTSEGQTVIDGPYTETKEMISGYYLIQATDYAAAAKTASGCPVLTYGGRVEVREIHEWE